MYVSNVTAQVERGLVGGGIDNLNTVMHAIFTPCSFHRYLIVLVQYSACNLDLEVIHLIDYVIYNIYNMALWSAYLFQF